MTMPDRLIRTADGLTGGMLVVLGLCQAVVGVSWWVWPTAGRLAAVDWLPVTAGTSTGLGWWLVSAGTITALGGALSRHRRLEVTAFVANTIGHFWVAFLYVVGGAAGSASAATAGPGAIWYLVLLTLGVYVAVRYPRETAQNREEPTR
ncbi:hypothetical protein [Tersicoccus sp. Bi-70]|uniref:hypothetical protein n=1 Tax=Tersicoccus sp. Bi-70 TaxID=1897634 RepID=UPI000976875F|nr:hypothetical protein [Tersicoccus sp. Bi-70]OMH30662.1 hypothetical protein BGP79_11935 [Tersicoccus sp. Bi-70]